LNPAPHPIRVAADADVASLVSLTNRAYEVEAFCLRGHRTNDQDLRSLMETGTFLLLEDPALPGRLQGSVYTSQSEGRGYLGLLSVHPECQGRGLARRLVQAVEDRCREAGCRFLDLSVVNLRTELLPFYAKLGFEATGALPFPRPEKVLQPLHLIQMTKAL
jgi:GNAT superfamily N-acetyltransferase